MSTAYERIQRKTEDSYLIVKAIAEDGSNSSAKLDAILAELQAHTILLQGILDALES